MLLVSLCMALVGSMHAQTLPAYLPSNGLVGWWPFNGNANDESGNGNHGTVNGATLTVDRNGNANRAYGFDGVNDLIVVSDNSILDLTGNFTISTWLNPDMLGTVNMILSKHDIGLSTSGGTYTMGLWLVSTNNSLVNFQATPNFNPATYPNVNGSVSVNNWMHFCITYDDSYQILSYFLDGALISAININFDIQNNSQPLRIGANNLNNTMVDLFSGILDDIAIYNRALTQEEITALYTGTSSNNNGGGGGGTVGTPAASVPAGIPYQAVIRDNAGLPLVNAPVTVRFTLHQNTTDGTVEYQEAHALTTNAFGLVNTLFGSGTASQGSFANINWSATTKFVQVEANSGAGYVEMGTQQMMSVPFAYQANKAAAIKNAGLPVYSDNAAALAGGLVAGEMYRTAAGILMIVY